MSVANSVANFEEQAELEEMTEEMEEENVVARNPRPALFAKVDAAFHDAVRAGADVENRTIASYLRNLVARDLAKKGLWPLNSTAGGRRGLTVGPSELKMVNEN